MGRDAASSAPSASASCLARSRCSGPLMPRPTETMRSACVRSTACFASRNGASGFCRTAPASIDAACVATGARALLQRVGAERANLERRRSAGPRRSATTSASSLRLEHRAHERGARRRRLARPTQSVTSAAIAAAPPASARSRASDRCARGARSAGVVGRDDVGRAPRRSRRRCSRPAPACSTRDHLAPPARRRVRPADRLDAVPRPRPPSPAVRVACAAAMASQRRPVAPARRCCSAMTSIITTPPARLRAARAPVPWRPRRACPRSSASASASRAT